MPSRLVRGRQPERRPDNITVVLFRLGESGSPTVPRWRTDHRRRAQGRDLRAAADAPTVAPGSSAGPRWPNVWATPLRTPQSLPRLTARGSGGRSGNSPPSPRAPGHLRQGHCRAAGARRCGAGLYALSRQSVLHRHERCRSGHPLSRLPMICPSGSSCTRGVCERVPSRAIPNAVAAACWTTSGGREEAVDLSGPGARALSG